MANADIRQLVMDGSVFYPQTDINALVNDGSFGIDDVPTAGSANLVTSGGVASHIVYDISEANNGTTYADLSAALDNGNNIPESIRKGGMSIKFVRTSDHKYVQYRLMSDSFNTIVANWQGVDDEPTAGSDNLVKSGGIKSYYIFVKNEEQSVIQCVAGQVIDKTDSLTNFSIKVGNRYKVRLEDTNNILSGNVNLYEEYSDGTRDTFALTPNYTVDRTAPKDIKDIYLWASGSVVANTGVITIYAEQIGTISNRVSNLESQMSSVNEDIEEENEKIQSLTDVVIGVNETKEINAVAGQEIGRRETSQISSYMAVDISSGTEYSLYLNSGNLLSTNPELYITYSDDTEIHMQINKNQDWYKRIAEKAIKSFGLYVGGPYVVGSGVVTFSVKTRNNMEAVIDEKVSEKTNVITNPVISDNSTLNRCIQALYIPNKKAEDISSIRIVKAAATGSLFYNALYVFFKDNTNVAIFTDSLYRTQTEAAEDCIGIRGRGDAGWAYIDFSSLSNGTHEHSNFNILIDISDITTFSVIFNTLRGNAGWVEKDYALNLIKDVICIGDSITEGNIYDAPYHSGVISRLSYPSQLAKMTGWEVVNAGKSGITTVGWWENEFSKYSYTDYKLAIIYLGTNGGLTETINTDAPAGTDYHNYADTNTGRLCSIIEGIKAQNTDILIAILIGSNLQAAADIPTIETIKAVAERYSLILVNLRESIHFRLIDDKYHGYANVGDQTLNYTHFNAAGYLTMAKAIKEYLSEWFDNNIKSVSNLAY